MSSAVDLLCMLLAITRKMSLTHKVGHVDSLGWIPVIQSPFNSSCAAL
jgi:hypothetical protein